MKNVWSRPFNANNKKEKELLVKWLYVGREKNRFDPEIFTKNQVRIYTLFDESGIIGFVPVTLAFLVESLAFKPGLDEVTEARALQTFQHILVHRAAENNIPDAFFATTDETLLKFVDKYGWKETVVPVRNLHFSSLEKFHEDK